MKVMQKLGCTVALAGLLVSGSANANTSLDLTAFSQSIGGNSWINALSWLAELGGTSSITANVTGVTSFDWDFKANDELPYDDAGYFIAGGIWNTLASVSSVGDFGNSAWQTFTFSTPYTGSLTFGVYNALDNVHSSQLFITNVSAVPEPETYAMLLAGLGLVGFMARRRKESAV